MDVILKDLGFYSVVVHSEAVASTFGFGVGLACVVHVGATVTSVCCVEDAMIISGSRCGFPYLCACGDSCNFGFLIG